MKECSAFPAIDPECQTLADLRALIPADASIDALRANAARLYDPAPPAPEVFVPTLAVALLDGFGGDPARWPDAPLIRDLHAAAIRALSPGPRAALSAAFHARGRLRLDRAEDAPSRLADLISTPVAELTAALAPIARGLSAEDIAVIAAADRGWRAAEHARVIADQVRDGVRRDEASDGWECLELAAFTPGARGWPACTAWVLIRALETDDPRGDALFLWERHAPLYLALPPSLRAPVLNAFRGAMERDPDWATVIRSGDGAPPPIPYAGPMV